MGQVYSTLDRLVKDNLVEVEAADEPGEERKRYRVTAAGLQALDLWLRRPPLKARPLRDELFVRLGLLLHRAPAEALPLIESQRRIWQVHMADLTRQKIGLSHLPPGPDRLRRELVLDAALLHAEADLRWLETLEAKLERYQAGGNAHE